MLDIDQEARQNVEKFLNQLQLCLDFADTNTIDNIESFPKQREFIKLATEDKLYALNFLSPKESLSYSLEELFKPSFIRKYLSTLLMNMPNISHDVLDNKFFKAISLNAQPRILNEYRASFNISFILTFDIQSIKKNIGQFMSTIFGIEHIVRISSYNIFRSCIKEFLNGSVPKCQGCVGGINSVIDRIYLTCNSSLKRYVQFKSKASNGQVSVIAYDKGRVWYARYKDVWWKLGCQSVHAFVNQFLS